MNITGFETIAAISTPLGKGGIAVIRICGKDALEIAGKIFKPKNGTAVKAIKSNYAVYGEIVSGGVQIDDGIATVFRAPKSFTGEDTVEISCHGGILITQRVLEAALTAGARTAFAGEFTKRAFLNGKITLTEAEAVGGLIDARTDKHLEISLLQSKGSLSKSISAVVERLTKLAASVYAYIDYPDEDMTDVSVPDIKKEINAVTAKLDALIGSRRYGKAISEGVSTVIIGKPNTGKSSLLNALVGSERAIVTDVAGTTRDVIGEQIRCGSVLLNLYDTAGIRESGDKIEKIGVERSREKLREAYIALAVFDGSNPLSREDGAVVSELLQSGAEVIAVINKSDLPGADMSAVYDRFRRVIKLSAKNREGVSLLVNEIEELCGRTNAVSDGEIILGAKTARRAFTREGRARTSRERARALHAGHRRDGYRKRDSSAV